MRRPFRATQLPEGACGRPSLLLLLLLVTPGWAGAAGYGSGWYGELQFSHAYEHNAPRSYKEIDQETDRVTAFSVGGGHSRKLTDTGELILSGYVSVLRRDRFERLDGLTGTLGVDYAFQTSPGYAAPWYRLRLDVTRFEYRRSDAREGYLVRSDLSANRRLSEWATGHLGWRHHEMVFIRQSERMQKASSPFDTSSDELYIGADVQLMPKAMLALEFSYRRGDFASTVSGAPNPAADYEAKAGDPAYDLCRWEGCAGTYAYRIRTDMRRADIALIIPGESVTLDLSARYLDASANWGRDYDNWQAQLGVVWSF